MGKKKKGNQSKNSGSILIAEDVSQTKPEVLPDNYHDAAPMQNHHNGASSNADSQRVGVSESDMDQEKRKNLEAKCVELQEEINKLEVERNMWSLQGGSLEERIKLLQTEVDSCIRKEASLEGKIDDLQSKNASMTMREGSLEERIKLLQNDMDSCIEKEASLEEKLDDLQIKNASMTMRESSIKEVISRLGDANEGLQKQVMELKVSRDSLAQENKQLTDSMSALESRMQHLEMVASLYTSSKIHGEERSHLIAAEASTNPDILNEDPSEKASEIHVEPPHLAGTAETPTSKNRINYSSTVKSSSSTDHASEFQTTMLESNENIKQSCSVNGIEDFGSMDQLQQIQLLGLGDSRVSEDVTSVPLDEIIQELQTTAEKIETEPVVPLSDAPLIGAPFRLISFVARFVSGADLVDQDEPKADR